MPRKKSLSFQEAKDVVIAELQAAGGQLSHVELMQKLEAAGNESALLRLHVLSRKDGAIEPFFVEGESTLRYRYPPTKPAGGTN